MGQTSFNPVTNWLSNLFKPKNQGRNVTGGGFTTTPPTAPTTAATQPVTISGVSVPTLTSNYMPYQVQTGDTFESIAAANGTSPDQIRNGNSNMHVAPPKGSYINIPSQATVYQAGGRLDTSIQTPLGASSFSGGGQYQPNLVESTARINTQLQNGQLPATIPFQATKNLINPATGKPFTDSDYTASGYTYNNQTQQWELPNANQQPSNQPAEQTANQPAHLRIINYNGRSMPAWEAELMQRRAIRKARERAQAVIPGQQATNAGSLPATTLDVQIGGG